VTGRSPASGESAPPISGVLETALYVDALAPARRFYEHVLGLSPAMQDERMAAYPIGGRSMLLLFRRASAAEGRGPDGDIPDHEGRGRLHLALAIPWERLADWEHRLSERGVAIESTQAWPCGGKSLFFRDPDGNLLELATPGLWPLSDAATGP